MQIEGGPNSLSHYGQSDEDYRGHDGPDDLEPVVSMRIGRALVAGGLSVLPDHPTQSDLRRGEGNAADDNRNHELPVNQRTMFGDRFRKPPMFGDKHSDRAERYDPDGYSKNASHRLSPSFVNRKPLAVNGSVHGLLFTVYRFKTITPNNNGK